MINQAARSTLYTPFPEDPVDPSFSYDTRDLLGNKEAYRALWTAQTIRGKKTIISSAANTASSIETCSVKYEARERIGNRTAAYQATAADAARTACHPKRPRLSCRA